MKLHFEVGTPHSIRAYTETQLDINGTIYTQNILFCRETIHTDWAPRILTDITLSDFEYLLSYNPEIIIIGHTKSGLQADKALVATLSKERIGMECMPIGAACRTTNVLFSEDRRVICGILF